MASRLALAALLAAALLVSPLATESKSFDFFFLVLQWPGSYCLQRAGCCKPTTGYPAEDFSVGSFMTYDSTTGRPVRRCNATPLDVGEVEEEMSELQLHWSNIKCPSNNGVAFWKNAWKYYGGCSEMGESQYFAAALELRRKIDPLSALANEGITPGVEPYRVEDIKSAVKKATGVTPLVRCSTAPVTGDFLLYEIHVCVDKDGETLVECPVSPYFKCSETVLFPPFDSNMLKVAGAGVPSADGNPIKMPTRVSTE